MTVQSASLVSDPTASAKARSLVLDSVTKRYGATQALRGVSIECLPGEVHAVIGENGSGKSTLLKVASGETRPDSGEIRVGGRPVHFREPRDAIDAGIALIPQEVPLCTALTVAENISLGALPGRRPTIDWRSCRRLASQVLEQLGEQINPSRLVGTLSADERQVVAIARALARGQQVLLLDEPTSSLSLEQANRLFEVLDRLRRQQITMVYVTQRLAELHQVADRVTVVRDGSVVAARSSVDIDEAEIAELMIGRRLDARTGDAAQPDGSHRLDDSLLRVTGMRMGNRISNVTMTIQAGEVVGVAGLVGSGAPELLEGLAGLHEHVEGDIVLDGKQLRPTSVRAAMARGVGYLPRDRRREAMVPAMSVTENLLLSELASMWPPFVSRKRQRRRAAELAGGFAVKAASMEIAAASLSGGNQQKLVMARVLANEPRLLLLNEPTRGVDVGAKLEIFRSIRKFAADGGAALVYSSEFKDLMEWCDRIVVMYRGAILTSLVAASCSEESLIRLASRGGVREPGETEGCTPGDVVGAVPQAGTGQSDLLAHQPDDLEV